MRIVCLSAAVLLAGMAAPSFAQAPAAAPSGSVAKTATGLDPNEVVCEVQELTGSRISSKRVCKTRSQWADERLQDRQEVERVQMRRGMKGN